VDPGQAFAVGLFSSLDVLVDAPLVAILERLSLSEPMRVALKDRAGDLGALLTSTLAYERGDWQHISCLGLSHGEIKDAFLSTVKWVEAVEQTLLMAEV
jgi:EAL and modified HD-GYP domain-containing signal transduction protein